MGPQSPEMPYTKHFPTKKIETQNPCILSKLILSLHQNSKTQIEMKKETIWGLLLLALLTCQSAKAYDHGDGSTDHFSA